MKKLLIIFILIITLITTCRLIHFFDDENSINQTTTTSMQVNRPIILLKDSLTGSTIYSDGTKNLGLIPQQKNNIVINLKIRNNGNKNLIINSILIKDQSNCSVTHNIPKMELIPSEEIPFDININFNGLGDTFFRLEINSNDPYRPKFNLSFKAKVVNTLYVSKRTGSDLTGDGTMTNPYNTINKALQNISPNSLICVAAGDYTEPTIDITSCVSLYGGYYCDWTIVDWDRRDVNTTDDKYITNIIAPSGLEAAININNVTSQLEIEGFTIAGPISKNISISNCENITIKNNIINLGSASSDVSGIYIMNSNNIIINNNKIKGGTAASSLKGIDCSNSSIDIRNNLIDIGEITSGSASTSCGIFSESCNISIENNNINNNSEASSNLPSNRYGIYAIDCNNIVIRNNQNISIGSSQTKTSGIYIEKNLVTTTTIVTTLIENNNIFVNNNSNTSNPNLIGLYIKELVSNNNDIKVYNNIIYANSVASNNNIEGISLKDLLLPNITVKLLNNTIVINGGNKVKGISLYEKSSPYIENNIIFLNKTTPIDPSADEYGIYESGYYSDPETIQNNCVFGFNYLYYDCDGTTDNDKKVKSFSDFNKSEKTNQKTQASVANNVSMNPNFVNVSDPKNGLRLQSSSPLQVKQGGKDQSSLFNRDKDYRPRTIPWSIGAYECDE